MEHDCPQLTIETPDSHRVVDVREMVVSGTATDQAGLPVSLEVPGGEAVMDGDRFMARIPLEPGVNLGVVKAVNADGCASAALLFALRMVTNRTAGDVEQMQALLKSGYELQDEPPRVFGYGQLVDKYGRFILDSAGRMLLVEERE